MTNEEYVRSLPIEELAKLLIQTHDEDIFDEDMDGDPKYCGSYDVHTTSDGTEFPFDDLESAVAHEVEWLRRERK